MGLHEMFFRHSLSGPDASLPQLRRLLLLENGVVNYGGGIFRLRAQVCACRQKLQTDDPDTAALLKIVEGYLEGLITVGELGEEQSDYRAGCCHREEYD